MYTVMRRGGEQNGAYSISMNFRLRDEGVHYNVLSILGWTTAWPQALLIRDCAQRTVGFPAALARMSSTKLIAPCYFVLAGCAAGQGVVIERSRRMCDSIDTLRAAGNEAALADSTDECEEEAQRFVLVTNCDLRCGSLKLSWTHEDPLLMNALLRRDAARRLFNSYFLQMTRNRAADLSVVLKGACDVSRTLLPFCFCNILHTPSPHCVFATHHPAQVLSSDPVNNYQTVFGVIMIPRDDVIASHTWPVSADSRRLDKRLAGGAYSDADLRTMRVVRD
jgi:hypothetical protein